MKPPRATIDFETRSACNLKTHGSWRYSLDPTTEVLCFAFRLPHWEPGRTGLWHPEFRVPKIREKFDMNDMAELFAWIASSELVEAHNAWFERGIWKNIMVPAYDWPAIQPHQWRCSAAKAAAHALPRALDAVAVVLDCTELKDDHGTKIMKRMTKPRRARKAERELYDAWDYDLPLLYFEDEATLDRLCAYCQQDVLTEEAVSDQLDDLNETETAVYLLDQAMNERGFALDERAIRTALSLIATETTRLNGELAKVTNGYVHKATERKNLMTWLESVNFPLPNTQKLTIDEALTTRKAPAQAKRAIEILQELGKSSTAKYERMRDWRCVDGRAHGGLLYHGASTGRWAGAGIQPQNFPKGKVKDIEAAWAALIANDRTAIHTINPSIMGLLSESLRGAIVPSPGHQLYVADYASIEARVLPWLAGDDETIELFKTGADIYCEMASEIYHKPCNKYDHPQERALGKVAILGLGYQMGVTRFIDTCWLMARIRIDEALSQRTVDAYRAKFWRVKQLWYDTERAAMDAVDTGEPQMAGQVMFSVEDKDYPFLYCMLPSGRRLAYPQPRLQEKVTPWGSTTGLTFMGINPVTRQWQRQHTYGGMLVENIDQAVARDLMAEAALRCEVHPVYTPILTVHDELIAEAPLGQGSVAEFEQLMAECPTWGAGIPVAAEGWTGLRYRK